MSLTAPIPTPSAAVSRPAARRRVTAGWLPALMALLVLVVSWLAAGPARAEPPATQAVRLHFNRVNHDYTGWGLHVWGEHLALQRDVTWERPLEPAGVDAYGVYFDVRVEAASRGFNFIVHRGETKNTPRDQVIVLAQHGREVWLLENSETVFTAPPPVGSDFQVGLETERRMQRNVTMLWGGGAAALVLLAGLAWAVQRRLAQQRTQLTTQLAQLMQAQHDMRQRSAATALDDELTGLPTRGGLQQALDQALARAARQRGRMAVLFIDLDGFKAVNDGAGHDAGDLVLQVLAQRFKACLRSSDMVARVGGDEFVAVVEHLGSPLQAFHIGRKLTAAARLPIEDGERRHQVGASIGVAVYPEDGQDAATLIKGADTAMYGAKKGGKDACRFLQPALQDAMDAHLRREASLRDALDRQALHLDFLPDQDLLSGRVLGANAVVRWAGDGGPGSLRTLFDAAHDDALAERLNAWTLSEASRQAQAWRQQGLTPVRLTVDLLGEVGPALVQAHRLLSGDRAAAHGLVVQLEAGVLLDAQADHTTRVDALHALGVGVAISGLGVRDVGLLRLVETPIDLVRIDTPAFVEAATPAADPLARTLVVLGTARLVPVVPADVDTPAHREWTRRIACGSTLAPVAAGARDLASFTAMIGRSGGAPSASPR